jgi:parallel beta-helix repeat protein
MNLSALYYAAQTDLDTAHGTPPVLTAASTIACLHIHVASAALVLCITLTSLGIAGAATITLSPGTNIQSAVNTYPSGTTFILEPGVYRLQSVTPIAGDTFIGKTGADLNGSQVLTNWVKSGSYWTMTGAPALNNPAGPASQWCNDPSSGCAYPQDLFLNNKPLVHKISLPLTLGQWYFDYSNDVIYMADDPTGQTVELSISGRAFSGYVNNITVQNLIVEKYATPLMSGAIAAWGSYWIIKSNEVRLNHAAGIKAEYGNDNYERILSNNVHNNGQQGIAVGNGTGTLLEYDTISNNNFANTIDGNEEGGGKIAATTNAQVINNTYSNNNGVGLWGDCGATGTVFSGNTITGNRLDGIRYEVSHYGTITNNTLINNVQYRGTGPCDNNSREIVLVDSDYTTVSHNTITSNCAGITLTQGHNIEMVGDEITDNNLTLHIGSALIADRIGLFDNPGSTGWNIFTANPPNFFDYNTYTFDNSVAWQTVTQWLDQGGSFGDDCSTDPTTCFGPYTWAGWQAHGQDIHGTVH